MMLGLVMKGLKRGKARFFCAVAGIAAATGAVVFMFSLTATNQAQAPALARQAAQPWGAWRVDGIRLAGRGGRGGPPTGMTERSPQPAAGTALPAPDLTLSLVSTTIDYRPGGHVLQGPPMTALIGAAPAESPFSATALAEGKWVDDAAVDFQIVCTRNTLRRFNRGTPPPLGTPIKFVGNRGTMTATVVGYLKEAKLPNGFPGVFANRAAFAALRQETHGRLSLWKKPPAQTAGGILTPASESVIASFASDEVRRMDYARPLMWVAAILTALCLLVNSLLLSIEANRKTLGTLRTLGLTRKGVIAFVTVESLLATGVGYLFGSAGALAALTLYVKADPVAFPTGPAYAWRTLPLTLIIALAVAWIAVLFVLRPALAVRPLDAVDNRPHRRRRGMAIAFACGFGAFVAVEVWGASLMRAFIPSPEWPDATVSILPEGIDPDDLAKVRNLPGAKRIGALYPLQLDFDPPILSERGGTRNALLLAGEWLPAFRFLEGTWDEADQAIRTSDACVITEMMSRAHNLHKGDTLRLRMFGSESLSVELPIAGVVDLNWHMVTSRGLVRGRHGASGMTDGPVFISPETFASLDPTGDLTMAVTHLWIDYDPAFLNGMGVFPAGREMEAAIAKALALDPAKLECPATVRLHARDEIADGTLAHGSDVIGQAARVPFVFLAILSIGFIAMLVADADAAKQEFAILRAVGGTRWQLAVRLAKGALRTALWGILAGLPLGALTGWLFTLKTGNWPGLPHYFVIPWRVISEGTLGAIGFVLLIAIPTALALIRRSIRR